MRCRSLQGACLGIDSHPNRDWDPWHRLRQWFGERLRGNTIRRNRTQGNLPLWEGLWEGGLSELCRAKFSIPKSPGPTSKRPIPQIDRDSHILDPEIARSELKEPYPPDRNSQNSEKAYPPDRRRQPNSGSQNRGFSRVSELFQSPSQRPSQRQIFLSETLGPVATNHHDMLPLNIYPNDIDADLSKQQAQEPRGPFLVGPLTLTML